MNSQQIIQDHDRWRKGMGGAPAGLTGQTDSHAYAGLDLNQARFEGSSFSGSSFSATTFQQAVWSGCNFTGCSFTGCDFSTLSIEGCTFTECNFATSTFDHSRFGTTQFLHCRWDDLSFHHSHWERVQVLECTGTIVRGDTLTGEHVDFTGSYFENLAFSNVRINN